MSLDTSPINVPPLDSSRKVPLLFRVGVGQEIEHPNTQAWVLLKVSRLRARTTGVKEGEQPLERPLGAGF